MQAKLGMAIHASNPSIYEWEAGDFEFKASLGYSFKVKDCEPLQNNYGHNKPALF